MNEIILNKPSEIEQQFSKIQRYRILRILIFQSMITAIFTYGVISSQYLPQPLNPPTDYQPTLNPNHNISVSCVLVLCLCLAGQLTGGHCNPIVTISHMLCKGNKITVFIALMYVTGQFIGAIVGGLVAWGLVPTFGFTQQSQSNSAGSELKILAAQIMGSLIFCLFILITTNQTTTFLKSTFWNYFMISIAWFTATTLTFQTDSLNPASTLSFQLFTGIKNNNWHPLQQYYLYLFGPILGTTIATTIFNLLYLPWFISWKQNK